MNTPGVQLQTDQSTTQLGPQMTHPKGGHSRHMSPTKVNPTPWSQLLHWSQCHSSVTQPESQSQTQMYQQQLRQENYTTHTRDTPTALRSCEHKNGKGHYYIRPLRQDWKIWQMYLIHRNKHREAAKMRRQRNISQMKDQENTSEK